MAKLQAHGEELFNQRCKSCHMPPVEHAPSRSELAAQFPNIIADALKTGKMQAMAAGLSDADIGAIASWVTVSVGKNPKAASGWAAYFGDMGRNQVAVDANTGKELWSVSIDAGPRGILTGAPAL